jgi:hypothetical protein
MNLDKEQARGQLRIGTHRRSLARLLLQRFRSYLLRMRFTDEQKAGVAAGRRSPGSFSIWRTISVGGSLSTLLRLTSAPQSVGIPKFNETRRRERICLFRH